MRIIDGHCDLLSRMLMDPSINLNDIRQNKIGAILTLEGIEGLMGSLRNLRIAYYLDGVLENEKLDSLQKAKSLLKNAIFWVSY
ncbi:MAG: hypothetical protein WD469_13560 [Paenibacillaceae bacterium]